MSTIGTPHQTHSKGNRRSAGKKTRQSNPHDGFVSDVGAPTEHQRNKSPAAGNAVKNNGKGHPRKNSSVYNTAAHAGKPDKVKGTPMKPAAYAGSTFQQSPAASALPLPSFYSKSMPAAGPLTSQLSNEASADAHPAAHEVAESPSKRESTPCDFLFDAARQARATPRGDTPGARSGNVSVPNISPASGSPAPREGDAVFPFELDGASAAGEDGVFSATPYKDRIEALKSTRSTSLPSKSMNEHERKAKTDALKRLLMKSSGEPGENSSQPAQDISNPFNARAPYQPSPFPTQGPPLVRHTSGPSLTFKQDHNNSNALPGHPQMPYQYQPTQIQTPKRPNSSSLRNVYGAQSEPEYAELSSDSAVTPPISTQRRHTPQHAPPYGTAPVSPPYSKQQQMPNHRAKPSAQQLEDDLRRVLKLDLTTRG
ncbi:uncharacterized protein PV06_09664 [Exophiala oligosperma]|uniref:Proteophosphoglycan 5 n=1 Tax=Exophiala oligosperma TaxID=215243 RepID=A0A0D2DSU8_9EURO|nr:uncharacterized protein PV06_09664 [Exophiala oligosperma]KIW38714.1 hypothetical protein PV06_09664 [Exophiala oligosperma]